MKHKLNRIEEHQQKLATNARRSRVRGARIVLTAGRKPNSDGKYHEKKISEVYWPGSETNMTE
ncbi:MAG: hypothetical protein WBF39_05910 [Planococcus donghaensis]